MKIDEASSLGLVRLGLVQLQGLHGHIESFGFAHVVAIEPPLLQDVHGQFEIGVAEFIQILQREIHFINQGRNQFGENLSRRIQGLSGNKLSDFFDGAHVQTQKALSMDALISSFMKFL
ncbi:hypothetical protein [Limnohabitans sp. Bal53]|uniref:hypothetical protein n=1 Tax=Limnohabitans sp. Bal53 TaxID=1977910 RepID=UPI001304D2F5|nr:hypothetical protein [Limnohabitans sp. Bal53]